MKPEQILNRLGLSANIIIVILLLVIIYYLHRINENFSLEGFSIGAPKSWWAKAQVPYCLPTQDSENDNCWAGCHSTVGAEWCRLQEDATLDFSDCLDTQQKECTDALMLCAYEPLECDKSCADDSDCPDSTVCDGTTHECVD